LDDGPAQGGHRPSGTVLLRSLAAAYGPRALGVVLTGMGRDGVDGLAALHHAGATTVVQDAASSVVDGMPKAARDAGIAGIVAPLSGIAEVLCALAGTRASS
jgi:two-component system chemotaxis response regulator CheB